MIKKETQELEESLLQDQEAEDDTSSDESWADYLDVNDSDADDFFAAFRPPRLVQGLAVSSLRDIGQVREINQDNLFSLVAMLPREGSDLHMGLFVVADGMGGHKDGEVASQIAIQTIVDHVFHRFMMPILREDMADAMQSLMVSAVEKANYEIWSHAQKIGSDMGATCTAMLLLGSVGYIAHVGDTRAYMLQNGTLYPLTTDHSAVGRLIQLGQLDPSAAREHPLRSHLYRCIGQNSDVEVELGVHETDNSTYLVLCSDGLWNMVLEDQICEIVTQSTCPADACQELVARANKNGGDDNISVIVVSLPVEEACS